MQAVTTATVQFAVNYVPQWSMQMIHYSVLSSTSIPNTIGHTYTSGYGFAKLTW